LGFILALQLFGYLEDHIIQIFNGPLTKVDYLSKPYSGAGNEMRSAISRLERLDQTDIEGKYLSGQYTYVLIIRDTLDIDYIVASSNRNYIDGIVQAATIYSKEDKITSLMEELFNPRIPSKSTIDADNASSIRSPSELNRPDPVSLPLVAHRSVEIPQQPNRETDLNPTLRTDVELNAFLRRGPKEPISGRTNVAIRRLMADLNQNYPGMILTATEDTGDCFYDAFAQGLSQILGRQVTIKELRIVAYNYVNTGNNIEWVKRILGDKFNEYKSFVNEDAAMAKSKGRSPVWGSGKVDGRIFMEVYNVNFRELAEFYFNENLTRAEGVASEDNRLYQDILYAPSPYSGTPNTIKKDTVMIANYPVHYLAVLGSNPYLNDPNRQTNPVIIDI
jgi:hypothetical protein